MNSTTDYEAMKDRAAKSDSGYTFRVVTEPITAEDAAAEILAGLDLLFVPDGKSTQGEKPDSIQVLGVSGPQMTVSGAFAFKAGRPDMQQLVQFATYVATGHSGMEMITADSQEEVNALFETLAVNDPEQFIEMMTASGICSRADAEAMAKRIQSEPREIH